MHLTVKTYVIFKIQHGGGRHFEKSKNVVLRDIIYSLLKTVNKTANINVKKLQLITLLTAMDRKLQKSVYFGGQKVKH